jgi:hypothetical protein
MEERAGVLRLRFLSFILHTLQFIACSKHGKMGNEHKFLIRKSEGKRALSRLRRRYS